jgi:hypothetical protein
VHAASSDDGAGVLASAPNAGRALLFFACVVIAVIAAFGCDARSVKCRFGREQRVFESERSVIDAVAIGALGARQLLVFSDPTGLFVTALAQDAGASRLRIGERCAGGLALVSEDTRAFIACLRTQGTAVANLAVGDQDAVDQAGIDQAAGVRGASALSLYALDAQLRVRPLAELGRAAPRSFGVALVRADRDLVVAWHDAEPGARRVWHARLPQLAAGVPGALAEPTLLSGQHAQAGPPTLALHRGHVWAAWSEGHLEAASTQIRITNLSQPTAAGAGAATTAATTRVEDALPVLTSDARGLLLAFRDRGRKHERQGLYAQRLTDRGSASGKPTRIARADGDARPQVASCARGFVFATPRTFGGEHFVGVVHSDLELSSISGEQQFYEDRHEFTHVASSCNGSEAESVDLVIAEQARAPHTRASIRLVTARCE